MLINRSPKGNDVEKITFIRVLSGVVYWQKFQVNRIYTATGLPCYEVVLFDQIVFGRPRRYTNFRSKDEAFDWIRRNGWRI